MTRSDLQAQLFRLRQARLTIQALELDLPKAHQAAAILAPDGHGRGRSDGPGAPGEHSDPTGDALIGFADIDELMEDIDLAIVGAVGTLRHAWQDATNVASRVAKRTANTPPAGQGWCRAHCGHWCPGTAEIAELVYTNDQGEEVRKPGSKQDRLRNGLCDPCDSWSRRNGRPDLSAIQAARRGREGNCQCDECKSRVGTYRGDAA